ncbi:hypothetical protein LEP1GSC088_2939 [Leptospira interrogans str. L1207]|nr:hypothetical protein LEP1GSC088_2939 [Leptospira interrogans str. L1207]
MESELYSSIPEMWELLRKFDDIRIARKFAKCDLICRNYYILLKISKGLSRKIF